MIKRVFILGGRGFQVDRSSLTTLRNYPFHIPRAFQAFYPGRDWRIGTPEDPDIYLSFDDGPTPDVTDRLLDRLEGYEVAATFFCIGKNAEKHPDLMKRIQAEGHGIGNHGYEHPYGPAHSLEDYVIDVEKAAGLVPSPLFRPPYGRLKRKQAQRLSKRYRIVMWEVLSGDFDPELDPEKSVGKILKHTRNGSILLFHDSEKARRNMEAILPRILEHFLEKGYRFKTIPGSRDQLPISQ